MTDAAEVSHIAHAAPGPAEPAPGKQRRSAVYRIIVCLVWVLALPAAAGAIASFLLPVDLEGSSQTWLRIAWTAFMVRTFGMHIAAALAAAAAVAALIRAPRLLVFTAGTCGLVAIMCGVSPTGAGRAPAPSPPGAGLTVMTSNLWRGLEDTTRIVELIDRESPDVIVFQEYTPLHDRELRPALTASYPHIEAEPQQDFSGMATYSRFPIEVVDSGLIGPRGLATVTGRFWDRQPCVVVTLPAADGTLTDGAREVVIQNVHMPTAPMGRNVLREHHRLVRLIEAWLRRESRPIICAGDFNCTPMSGEADIIRSFGLTDAHRAVGGGLGATWGWDLAWPGFRIDHIYSRGLTPTSCRVGPDVGSDHRPVIATYVIPSAK